jgi:hypothetical protein
VTQPLTAHTVERRARAVPRSYELLVRVLDRPRSVLWVTGFAFMLSLPAMATGLVADDYILEAAVSHGHDPLNAFTFQSRDPVASRAELLDKLRLGSVPWWTDEQFHQAFLRPLASLTHAIDFRLWPRAVPWMHFENIVVFAVAVWLAGLIYTELALPRAALGLATFFYAMSANHAISVAWLSGRNTLLATAFGLLAIWLDLRAANGGGWRRLGLQLLAAAALGAGLLSAEFGAGAAGFLLAHALTLRDGPLVRRLVALWPYAVVLAAWQAVYIAGNYGAIGSGFYHGPAQEPGLFARGVVTGVPIYLASQLVAPIATFSCFFSVRPSRDHRHFARSLVPDAWFAGAALACGSPREIPVARCSARNAAARVDRAAGATRVFREPRHVGDRRAAAGGMLRPAELRVAARGCDAPVSRPRDLSASSSKSRAAISPRRSSSSGAIRQSGRFIPETCCSSGACA